MGGKVDQFDAPKLDTFRVHILCFAAALVLNKPSGLPSLSLVELNQNITDKTGRVD